MDKAAVVQGPLFESRFTLSFNEGKIRVWRRSEQRFHYVTMREHNRYGGGSVMLWGGFGMHHGTFLHRVRENLTGIVYGDDILQLLALSAL